MIVPKPSMMQKTGGVLNPDVNKVRHKHVKQEREGLYEDVLSQKVISNYLKDENKRLKTRNARLEYLLLSKEKMIEELIIYQTGGVQNLQSARKPQTRVRSPRARSPLREAEEMSLVSKL